MAYHHSCYENKFGKTAKKVAAKYESVCSICNETIKVGDMFTWARRASGAPGTQGDGEPEANGSPAPTPTPVHPPDGGADGMMALAAMLMPALRTMGIAGMPQAEKDALCSSVVEAASKAISAAVEAIPRPTKVELVIPELGEPKNLGTVHKAFPLLLKTIAAAKAAKEFGIWLTGPSGSGKTTAVIKAAEALTLKFYYTGAITEAFSLLGYTDAHGKYVRTAFRDAYEYGGLFLWDEIDASAPDCLLAFNAAITNGHAAFPDGVIARHSDFIPVAAANTWGHGGTHEYVGRNKLDMATLKRFAQIAWDYDWDMVKATCSNIPWVMRVKAVSDRVKAKGIRVVVTPRECYIGASLLAAGIDQEDVEAMTIRSGMTQEQWSQVS
jgi:hypothetical protein